MSKDRNEFFPRQNLDTVFFKKNLSLVYHIVLVSGVQQSDSFIYIHISIVFQILFPCRVLQNTEYEFPMLYSRSLVIIYFMYSSVYLLIPNS